MSTVNTTRDFPTVFENLVEAAMFPGIYYQPAPWNTFPESNYDLTTQVMKGEVSFNRKRSKTRMPWFAFFYNSMEENRADMTQCTEYVGQVMLLFAHQHPNTSTAMASAKRDRDRAVDIARQNLDVNLGLVYGPFGVWHPSVVPASFGTVLELVDCLHSNPEVGTVKEWGPDVVVASVALNITLNVS